MTEDIVIVTGGFDPLHSGHIAYINEAAKLGRVVVGVNSDEWLIRKKGASFMNIDERLEIIRNLKNVMWAIGFDDSDGTAKDAIRIVREMFNTQKIIFANGGDRTVDNIPEMDFKDDNLIFKFGIGGEDKKNSSSWILKEWNSKKTERPWGYYRVLHELPGVKVKELVVNPGQKLSMQRHSKRAEYWFVAEGACEFKTEYAHMRIFKFDEQVKIPVNAWHQLSNPFGIPCKIIEIQYGEECIEEDIERKE